MASGIKTEIEGDETLNPTVPVLITFDQIKTECKVETETNNEPITPYSGGEMSKPQDNFNSDVTGNMTETITHSTKKMKIDNHFKKRVTCSVCNKSVLRKSYLKYHLRIHSGQKPDKCDLCGKTLISNSTLSQHLMIHCGNKANKCEMCGKAFILKSSLSKHLKTHSGEKLYKCEKCDKGFISNLYLSNHLKFHSGVKLYKCEKCAKIFSKKTSLNKHILSHNDNQYNCKTCGRSESCEDCLYFK